MPRRCRGIPRGIITRLSKSLKELEKCPTEPDVLRAASRALKGVGDADANFKRLHMATIELLESEDNLSQEQTTLEEYEALVEDLITRLSQLTIIDHGASSLDPRCIITKRLDHIENKLTTATSEVEQLSFKLVDKCIICQWEERLHEIKQEFSDVAKEPIIVDLDEKDELIVKQTKFESCIFDNSLALKCALNDMEKSKTSSSTTTCSIKLPKTDISTFSGDVIGWKTFWEQFNVAVHSFSDIPKPEKLVYLRQSLKSGSAKNVIEGLSNTSEDYDEAIKCLADRYDRPRLIHQAHVKTILDIPPLKTGSGKELRNLHDMYCSTTPPRSKVHGL